MSGDASSGSVSCSAGTQGVELEMISRSEVQSVIGEPDFSRGEDYFLQGRVRSINIADKRNNIGSTVSGSRGNVYHQDINLNFAPYGDLDFVSGKCSCPVGFNCKHVVAALLHVAARFGAGDRVTEEFSEIRVAERTDPLSERLSSWLKDISEAGESPSDSPAPRPSAERLFYVFRAGEDGQPEITPYKARLKKDGEIGANPVEYRYSNYVNYPRFVMVEDVTILSKLSYFSTGTWPRTLNWPKGEKLSEFLKEIVGTGRARAGNIRGPMLAWGQPRRVNFEWVMSAEGDQSIKVRAEDGAELTLLPFCPLIYLDISNGLVGIAETDIPAPLAMGMACVPTVPAVASGVFADELARIGGENVPKPRTIEVNRRSDITPQPVLTLSGVSVKIPVHLRGYFLDTDFDLPSSLVYPCARLEIAYEGVPRRIRQREGGALRIMTEQGVTEIVRQVDLEWQFANQLTRLSRIYQGAPPESFEFEIQSIPRAIRQGDIVFPSVLEGDDLVTESLIGFMTEAVPEMRREGWQVEIEKSWPLRLHEGPVGFGAGIISQGKDWFSLSINLEAGGDEVDIVPMVLSIIDSLPLSESGELEDGFDLERFLSDFYLYPMLEDGTSVPVEAKSLIPFIKACIEAHGLTDFHKAEAGRFAAFAEALEGSGVPWRGGGELLELGRRLRALAAAPFAEPPQSMTGTLRPYQKLGYGWLLALYDSGFGGVLADDMGLGKTIQALALLAHRHLETGSERPSLLVVPTSLLGNWMREAARFVPGLKLLILWGPDRYKRFGEIPDHHLVITTYPLVNRDYKELFSHEYDLAILDEAQSVKNPAASTARRIRGINACQRIALTGTPMENNLEELWALYDWLIPGFLGDRKLFNKHYRTPIEKHGDRARQLMLSRRLKPFLLRRTKEEVAKDLPPKTEVDEVIPLTGGQRTLYETIRVAMDERIRAAVRAKGISGSRITILDAILKLRQACCDPALVKLKAAEGFRESAKRKRLFELVAELVAEGRKVLVFSQFVEMLRLIERDVQDRGWDYAMLHGQTKKRDEEISKFQEGEAQIFLISLRAGGTGLNLTAADTVILYDPWWNPAVERQAMDRAHRIGQEKPVFVYRLIAEGSIEATILEMQARKQALADALFEGGGEGSMTMTQDDLDALLMPIA